MLKQEVKKIVYRKQFAIVFIIFFVAAIMDFLITCKNYYGMEVSWVRSAYKCGILTNEIGLFTCQFFSTLFPIMVCAGVSDIFCTENAMGITNFIYSRTTPKKNIMSKTTAVILVSFFMTFVPLIINFLLTFTAFPLQGFYCSNASYLTLSSPEEGRILGYLEMFYPYCNCIVYILVRCIVGSTLALFSFSLSLLKCFNKYVILFSGMVYYLCYSCIVGLPAFSNTVINTDIFAINGYGSGWMIFAFILFSWLLSFAMIMVGIKKETY
jgi:hypothetical protein